jgi:putative transcriptional regulator
MVRNRLAILLAERKWNQSDLVRATGIRQGTINDIYNEISERISFDQIDLICEALECEISDFLIRTPNKEPRVHDRSYKTKK